MTQALKEFSSSHAPALVLLEKLGYEYITPADALVKRGGRKSMPILLDVLKSQLRKMNHVSFRGEQYAFSDANIARAVRKISAVDFDSLIHTSEQIYDLLTLGISLEQTIDGYVKSHSLHYIDWKKPENNVFHVVDEFEFERRNSKQLRRPDMVLFVNGIPLAIIECKAPGKGALKEGISQHIRNQRLEEVPELYVYSQLLFSLCQNEAKYGTTGTDHKFWSIWKDELNDARKKELEQTVNAKLSEEAQKRLLKGYTQPEAQGVLSTLFTRDRLPSVQDKTLCAMCRPERLLSLVYGYIVYDNKVKKVARYQQYFAIQATLERVTNVKGDSQRKGGVIWHTTGSGKSLTMVMLAKALVLHPAITNPKVIIITDRVDLDDQITGTFKACGKSVEQAKTGEHLIRLVNSNSSSVITSIIDKFQTAAEKRARNESRNIFVLVDESHRSQYGYSHASMRRVFPNACYIGFTGTPLLKKEKSTANQFGGFIHKYTMNQAVQDKAVAPLRYEGRMSELRGGSNELDRWFDRITKDLTDEQKADLKRKFKQANQLLGADARVAEIGHDITQHFNEYCRGTGKKAQFAVESRKMALAYKRYFEEFTDISVAVVMSSPDSREGNESVDASKTPEVQIFWQEMMDKYGNKDAYRTAITDAFDKSDEPEILIVVSMLLTGFDAPRNSVLYLDKNLKDHNILQAIARVNRLWDGKDYGLVIDYRGIFGALNEAIDTYAALEKEGFDREDIEDTIIDVSNEISKLKTRHTNVWEIFNAVSNKKDPEAMQLALEYADIREQFYERVRLFASTLQLALSNVHFLEETPEKTIERYKSDLKYFIKLRATVKLRFGDSIDYSAYEKQLENIVNKHIGADTVTTIVDQVDLFQVDKFEEQLKLIEGDAAKADHIAAKMRKTITEKMDEDPALYKRLSEIIAEAIADHRAKRLSDADFLNQMQAAAEEMRTGTQQGLPSILIGNEDACAYYGVIVEQLESTEQHIEALSELALEVESIITSQKIRDWQQNQDVIRQMEGEIDDKLFDVNDDLELGLSAAVIDDILVQLITVAKRRDSA